MTTAAPASETLTVINVVESFDRVNELLGGAE